MKGLRSRLGAISLVLLLGACAGDSAEDHLNAGRDYLAAGDTAAAVLELKNALQKDQNLAEARWLLGSTYLQMGDMAAAAKELQRAMWLEWEPDQVVPAYASALVATGEFAEVVKLSEEGLSEESLGRLYTSKALARLGLGENREARQMLDMALAYAPDSVTAHLAQAQLFINLGDLEGAEASLETLLEKNPDNAAAWFARAELAGLQRDPAAAAAAYDKVLELEPGHPEAIRRRTMLALDEGDIATARKGATQLLRANQKDPGANLVMGVVELQNQRYEEALKRLDLARPLQEQYPLLDFFLGVAHVASGNLEQAASFAARFYATAPGSIRGRKLLATVRLQEDDYQAVEDLLRPVVEQRPEDVGAMRLLANALLRQGETDEGIALLSRVAGLQPDSPDAQISLGAGLLIGGKAADAETHIETALELDPQYRQADMLLVLSLVQQGEFDAALEKVRDFAARNPNDSTPLNLEGWVHARAGNPEAARASYEKVRQKYPGDVGANHALAQLALQKGELDTAAGYYRAILEEDSANLPALLQLALIEQAREDYPAMIDRLERAVESHPRALEPRLLLARHYLGDGRPDKVAPAFVGLPEPLKQDPAVLQLTALAQLAGREHAEALFSLEQLSASDPDSAPAHYLTALAAAGSGDISRAERELDRALELNPSHLGARLARAKLNLRLGREEPFREDLAVLEKELPDNADVLLLRAAAAELAGDLDAALELAAHAREAVPITGTIIALGSYHEKKGDLAGAQKVYREWLAEHPDDVVVQLKLADSTMASGGDATGLYRDVLSRESDNVIALNNMAWLLRESEPKISLQHARRAGELAPDNAAVLDTLAVVEYLNGNLPQAERAIRRALLAAPDQPSLLYHRAMIDNARGEKDAALETLQKLLDGGDTFPERAEAEALLKSLRG